MLLRKIALKTKEAGVDTSRDIIVVGNYAFYRSTGESSGFGGIWMPVTSIGAEPMFLATSKSPQKSPESYIYKPSAAYVCLSSKKTPNEVMEWFGDDLKLLRLLDRSKDFYRFGNVEAMLISLALDEKAWNKLIDDKKDDERSKDLADLKKYILTTEPYKNFIERIKNEKLQVEKKPFMILDESASDYSAKKVNDALKDIGHVFEDESFPDSSTHKSRVFLPKEVELPIVSELRRNELVVGVIRKVEMKAEMAEFLQTFLAEYKDQIKTPLLERCLKTINTTNDSNKIDEIFKIAIATALQRQSFGVRNTSRSGEKIQELINLPKYAGIKAHYFPGRKDAAVQYRDLRVIASEQKSDVPINLAAFFSSSMKSRNFEDITRRLDTIDKEIKLESSPQVASFKPLTPKQ